MVGKFSGGGGEGRNFRGGGGVKFFVEIFSEWVGNFLGGVEIYSGGVEIFQDC